MLKKWYDYMAYPRTLSQIETQDFKLDFGRCYRRPST